MSITEQEQGFEQETEQGVEGNGGGKGSRKGSMPVYDLRKVDGLPEDAKAQGRSHLYHDLLVNLTADPGEWYEVAKFTTTTGATTAKKAIESGERLIPAGDWEFASRKVQISATKRGSALYARYMGE